MVAPLGNANFTTNWHEREIIRQEIRYFIKRRLNITQRERENYVVKNM